MPKHVKFGLEGETNGIEFDQVCNCFYKEILLVKLIKQIHWINFNKFLPAQTSVTH